MKRLIVTIFCLVVSFGLLRAQKADSLRTVEVEEIVVRSERSLRDIGVQKSVMSERVLKENLSASMAEVLAQNSTIFIKSSGRATLSTASLRGTAPSHTAVTWNGIELGSPMLGMVDFSLIPSYFVDGSEVFHGATSTSVTGGGLGGAVVLSTKEREHEGVDLQYIQSVASFNTFDEYLRVDYGRGRWSGSTRALCSTSDNDFPYTNYDKLGHPREYNTNCGYRDLHLLQELYARGNGGGRWSAKVWYTDSSRGIPRMTVDFRDDELTKAWQDERSLRSVAEWRRAWGGFRLSTSAGYNYNTLHYIYQYSLGGGVTALGVDSESVTHHGFLTTAAEWSVGNSLMLAANIKGGIYDVESKDVAPLTPVGFEAGREEVSAFLSARWKPAEWLGLALNGREEWKGGVWSPLIPAFFIDATIVPEWGLMVSGSVARNYRYPTLNDLYYVPGGNPDLLPEEGKTFDLGVESGFENQRFKVNGKIAGYYSDINNWILWTPTIKGFWTPQNLQRVVSRGVEMRVNCEVRFARKGRLECGAIVGYTSSTNATEGSEAFGRQLPYIPLYSASANARLVWGKWEANYKWRYYSERATSYSGIAYQGSSVPAYRLSDVSVARDVAINKVRLRVRLEVNNLFNTYYQSVLSRPMPPRNYALSLECKFGM